MEVYSFFQRVSVLQRFIPEQYSKAYRKAITFWCFLANGPCHKKVWARACLNFPQSQGQLLNCLCIIIETTTWILVPFETLTQNDTSPSFRVRGHGGNLEYRPTTKSLTRLHSIGWSPLFIDNNIKANIKARKVKYLLLKGLFSRYCEVFWSKRGTGFWIAAPSKWSHVIMNGFANRRWNRSQPLSVQYQGDN